MQQEILAANPDAPLRVFAVWFNNFEGDERELLDSSLLADARVTQLWDEEKLLGRFYARGLTRPDDPSWVEWDAFFVYGADDTWAASAARPRHWGRPIVGKRNELRAAVSDLLKRN